MNSYTIGQVARAAGVPTSTIRFYERAGLFRADARSGGNYRLYSNAAVERLRFMRSAQSAGFSLKDIRELLGLIPSDQPPCDDIAAVMQKRLAQTRQRIKDLRRVERVLARSLAHCCRSDSPDFCNQLVRLRDPKAAECNPRGKNRSCA